MQSEARSFITKRSIPASRPTHRSGRTRRQTGPPVPALECRRARRPGGTGGAERQAQLRQRPQRLRLQDPAPLRAGPGSGGTTPRSGQPNNEIIFLREDDEDDANEISPTVQFIDTNEA